MIQRTAPLKRSPPPQRRTGLSARRPGKRRVSALRDGHYLEFLRDRQCIACRQERSTAFAWNRLPKPFPVRSEAAHTKNNGMGSKGPDSSYVPLCAEHRREQHQIGVKDFALFYGLDLAKEAAAHFLLYQIAKEDAS